MVNAKGYYWQKLNQFLLIGPLYFVLLVLPTATSLSGLPLQMPSIFRTSLGSDMIHLRISPAISWKIGMYVRYLCYRLKMWKQLETFYLVKDGILTLMQPTSWTSGFSCFPWLVLMGGFVFSSFDTGFADWRCGKTQDIIL